MSSRFSSFSVDVLVVQLKLGATGAAGSGACDILRALCERLYKARSPRSRFPAPGGLRRLVTEAFSRAGRMPRKPRAARLALIRCGRIMISDRLPSLLRILRANLWTRRCAPIWSRDWVTTSPEYGCMWMVVRRRRQRRRERWHTPQEAMSCLARGNIVRMRLPGDGSSRTN